MPSTSVFARFGPTASPSYSPAASLVDKPTKLPLDNFQMSSHLSRTITTCYALVVLVWSFSLSAQINVLDDGVSLVPDPVNIIVGGSVTWTDDGTGPYRITSDTGSWITFPTPGGVRFSVAGTYSYHDDAGNFGSVIVSPNLPPSVTITNPASNAVFSASANFTFAVNASDPDTDGLLDVEFYVGTNMVDDVFMAPFSTTVTNLGAGSYILTAIAYDKAGASATNQIPIFVGNAPLSLAPPRIVGTTLQLDASGLVVGSTNILQVSSSLSSKTNWVALSTNVAASTAFTFTNPAATNTRFFRLIQLK